MQNQTPETIPNAFDEAYTDNPPANVDYIAQAENENTAQNPIKTREELMKKFDFTPEIAAKFDSFTPEEFEIPISFYSNRLQEVMNELDNLQQTGCDEMNVLLLQGEADSIQNKIKALEQLRDNS